MINADIAKAIESFAPLGLQEDYDNAGWQVGLPSQQVNAVLLCLDVTEDVIAEAERRQCSMVVAHHPLIFRGLKHITGADPTERIVMRALKSGIAIYAAHTNLDAAKGGVSCEMAAMLGLKEVTPLQIAASDAETGIGVVGVIQPTPKLEFLRKVKDIFSVNSLRYAVQWPGLVVKRVALCGGSGASLIKDALNAKADIFVTGDLKYHDYTSYGDRILLADIGHYESELCAMKILSRIIRQAYPSITVYFSDDQRSPIASM